MRIIFVKFREISQKYPIVRGMASYSIIWPIGNFLQQKITGKEEFNYMEAVRFSLYGGLYVAPTLYCWLKCASRFWPKADLKSAITKALIEQVTYGPAAMCSFFFGMSLLELKPVSECIDEVKIKFWPTYKVNFLIMGFNQYCLLQDIGSLNSVTLKLNNTLEDYSLFSTEVYVKAPILLRMLHSTITAEVFQKGLIKYLATYQFKSTTPDDLWSTMQSALDESNVPHKDYKIKGVMDTWMNQDRYPIVNVKKNYETGEVTISQICFQRFNETVTNKWWIPVTFATQSNPNFSNTVPRHWLRPDQNISFTINSNDWIIVNLQQTGYYRVNYDIRNWYKISNYLHSGKYKNIHVFNRAQIINDAFFFIMEENKEISGYLFINIISYLSQETDYMAWYPLFRIITRFKKTLLLPGLENIKYLLVSIINNHYQFDIVELTVISQFSHFKTVFNNVLFHFYTSILRIFSFSFLPQINCISIKVPLELLLQKIGYEENPHDDDLTIVTRVDVLKFACIFGHVNCKTMAAIKLSKYLENPRIYKIPQWQKFVYCSGLMTANKATWDKMLKLYLKKTYKTEKYQKKLLKSLSCAENPDIIINYLNITAFNTSLFHDKEHSLAFMYIIENHARNDLILDYVLNNFEIIKPKSLTTNVMITLILSNIYSDEQIDKVNFI
ncbi:Aminopeptidase N [Trachymyrmex septentrionalis]|uniref:Aminopeptidase N n=1 Tax=Trachymyrmex septentrionalis TaxID=34720 RepID=A0A195FN02_9HYME|nr:Aminopeptidase N [Trachymyrmex septentrionalis]